MKTLIVYATKYGSTEKCAKMLSEKLTKKPDLINLKTTKNIDLSKYDKVIIGGSIYAGRIRKEVKQFCANNLTVLITKKIGLFISCMAEGDTAIKQLDSSFSEELIKIAVAKESFGGEAIVNNMKPLDRFIMKKVSKTEQDMSKILSGNIERLAKAMDSN